MARTAVARLVQSEWLAPEILRIRFTLERRLAFEAGQFLAVAVPLAGGGECKRLYSLACSAEEAARSGVYEWCVRIRPGGIGSAFLLGLRTGDRFRVAGPFGRFVFRPSAPDRAACFIATGTGIAPVRSILFSAAFARNRPAKVTVLFGARDEQGLVLSSDLRAAGANVIPALSEPGQGFHGFQGRVTDYLQQQARTGWLWHATDFYVCGHGGMVSDVTRLLRDGHGVPESAIARESFGSPQPEAGGARVLAWRPGPVTVGTPVSEPAANSILHAVRRLVLNKAR